MIQIYCGDGKGKTTAAAGAAIRGAGHEIPIAFFQFMKQDGSGEIRILKKIPGIWVVHAKKFYGFTKYMNQQEKTEMKQQYEMMLRQAEDWMKTSPEKQKIIVLDEVIHACNQRLLDEEKLCALLSNCPKQTEIILTGRNPSRKLLEYANYVSDIKKIKHPYDLGIPARKGIEL